MRHLPTIHQRSFAGYRQSNQPAKMICCTSYGCRLRWQLETQLSRILILPHKVAVQRPFLHRLLKLPCIILLFKSIEMCVVVNDCCLIILCLLLPPLAVFLRKGCSCYLLLSIVLTIIGLIPGIVFAFCVCFNSAERQVVIINKYWKYMRFFVSNHKEIEDFEKVLISLK